MAVVTGIKRPDDKREMRAAIVAAWNDEDISQAQLGERFGMPRASIGRILTEERAGGAAVRRIDPDEAYRRYLAARRAKEAERAPAE